MRSLGFHRPVAVVAVGLVFLALFVTSCSDGDAPAKIAPVETATPRVPAIGITATPATAEPGPERTRAAEASTPTPHANREEVGRPPTPAVPAASTTGPLSLEELDARQAEGRRLERIWRRDREPLPRLDSSLPYVESLPHVYLHVGGPIPVDHFRVTGVSTCLNVRADPSLDAEILHCLPEGTIVRDHRHHQPIVYTNEGESGSIRWRPLIDAVRPYDAEKRTDRVMGWASDRYLLGSQDISPDPSFPSEVIHSVPVVRLEVAGDLPPSHVRVQGTDGCLEVRRDPNTDAEVLHCLPEDTVVRYRPVGDANSWEVDGIVWRLLTDAIGPYSWVWRNLGWANAEYLEGDEVVLFEEMPVPHEEFPDDLALIYRVAPNIRVPSEGVSFELPLYRIYRRNGVLTKEVLFSPDHPGPQSIPLPSHDLEEYSRYLLDSQMGRAATPDGSRIVVALCHWAACIQAGLGGSYYQNDPPSPHSTDLYESTDGGVTWHHTDTLAGTWDPRLVSSSSSEVGPQLLLFGYALGSGWYSYMLHPGGEMGDSGGEATFDELRERVVAGRRVLPEYTELEVNKTRDWPYFRPYLWLSENEIFGNDDYFPTRLLGGAAMSFSRRAGFFEGDDQFPYYAVRPWPTIYNLETGELRPIALPPHVLRAGDWLFPFAVQHGPFLRVVNVEGGCLALRAEPSPDAEELDCVAERVLLQDQGEAVDVDGVTWRKARTPAGVLGWLDSRFLE